MRQSRRAITTALAAAIAVVLIVAAAGAYVLFISPKGPATSSSLPGSSTPSVTTSSVAPSTTFSTQTSSPTTSSSSATQTATTPTTTSATSFTTASSTSSTHATSVTSPSSSSTTSTVSTSVSTSTSVTTSTCTSTSSTTNSTAGAQVLNFSQTFAEYSEMAVHFNGTENGNTFDEVYDYHVVNTTSTAYRVNVTLTAGPIVVHYIDYVLKNGTATWAYYDGQNYTGANAFDIYFASMAPYLLGNVYGATGVLGQLSNSSLIHVAGSYTQMLGPTQVNVTDYEANYLPVKESTCSESFYFTRLSLQVGNVTGESVQLLTGMDITGTITSQGVTDSLDISLHITSVTKSA